MRPIISVPDYSTSTKRCVRHSPTLGPLLQDAYNATLKVSARDCEQDFTVSVKATVPFWCLPAQYPYWLMPILFDSWT